MIRFLLLFISLLSVPLMGADSTPHQNIKVCGDDEAYCADVELLDAKRRLLTTATVTVEQVFGQDPHATTWFYFGTDPDAAEDADGIGAAGDTVRVQIPAAVSPIGTVYPAVDVTTTITAGDVADPNPERAVAIRVCNDLEGDSNFQTSEWNCIVIKDHSGVFLESKLFNEFGERTTWTLTFTGTTVGVMAFDDIMRRGLPTELSRSPNDPRQGILGISGTVVANPGGVGDLIIIPFENGGSADMRVDGSVTPVDFTVDCSNDAERLIQEIRVFGGCNGLKFGQHLCKNQKLTNGVVVTIRSDGETLTLPMIYATEDWKNKFAFGPAGPGGNFRIDVQAGGDQFIASFIFDPPAIVRACGTVPIPDDELQITIQDNLTGSQGGNLAEFSALASGFEREP